MIVNLISPDGTLRQPLPEQLRDDLRQGRAGPAAGRGRHHLPRPARLQPAGLARPRQAGGPEPERHGRGHRHQPAERAGGRRADRPAARARRASNSSSPSTPWAGSPSRSSSPTSSSRPAPASPSGIRRRRRLPAATARAARRSLSDRHRPACTDVVDSLPASSGSATSARVELGSQQYDQSCTLDGQPSVALSIYQLPGSNALDTRQGRLRQDEGAARPASPTAWTTRSSTTPRPSSASRSTRSSTRCATR